MTKEQSVVIPRYQAMAGDLEVPTLPCPFWTWSPISVTMSTIFSNNSFGEWSDVNLIFLSDASWKSHKQYIWTGYKLNARGNLSFPTSFSKKPERSSDEDIPISWNALICVGEAPFSPDTLCCRHPKHQLQFKAIKASPKQSLFFLPL